MKRTAKILLSTMLVLMFVFSFAGAVPAAWAAYNNDGGIETAFSLWQDKTDTEEAGYRPYDDAENPITADFGMDEENRPISTIRTLKKNGVSVTIPEGLYVESVTLSAKEETDSEHVLNLSKYAVLSGQSLVIPASAFDDKADGSNILDVLSSSDIYVFSVSFHRIDAEAVVEVTYTDGELGGKLGKLFEDGDKYTVAGEGHEVKAIPQEKENDAARNYAKGYAGWKLVYPSGISMDVSVGSVIHPYIDAELVAQWEDIIVVIASQDGDKIYDGTAHKAAVKVNGVPVSDESNTATVTLNGSSVTVEITDYDTDNSSITNFVKDGKVYTPEVSATYEDNTPVDSSKIRIFPGTLTIEPVEIQISSASDKKDYDGTPLTAATPEVCVGGIKQTPVLSGDNKPEVALVGEDKLTITVSGTITDVKRDPDTKEVLSVENTVDYTLSGIQDNYHISVTKGTLTVNPRPLTLTTAGAIADYTGTPLTKNGKDDYTVEGLLEGHKATVTVTGSQTVPGTSDNTADIVIKDADGKDVTANYAVTKKLGTLTVNALTDTNRIALTIAPEDVTAEYDGTAHGASVYKIVSGKLPDGVTLTVTYSGERTDAGEGETSIGLATFLQDGTDVTANFNVTAKTGKITVSQRPITVTADSATKEYDTKPLTKDTASVTSGSLVSGHKLAAAEVVGSQTEVGDSKNTIKENSVKITDAKGSDVTKNYAITLKDGTLKVTGKAITDITVTVSATKVYDGTALTITDKDLKVTPALPSGYTISATLSPNSRTDAGKDEVTITNVVIKDASGKDVTASKFNVKVEKGTLEVTARPLTITTGDKTKVYDGTALTDKTVPTIEGQLKAHNMKLEFTGSQTKVGSSDNSVKVLSIYDKETNADVTKNYKITYKFGKLTVTSGTGTTNSGTTNNRTPQTGDTNNIWLWIGLMVVAAAVVVVIIVVIRRKNKGGAPDGSSQNKE